MVRNKIKNPAKLHYIERKNLPMCLRDLDLKETEATARKIVSHLNNIPHQERNFERLRVIPYDAWTFYELNRMPGRYFVQGHLVVEGGNASKARNHGLALEGIQPTPFQKLIGRKCGKPLVMIDKDSIWTLDRRVKDKAQLIADYRGSIFWESYTSEKK